MYKIVEHPLIKMKLSRMRNKNTDSRDFRSNLLELSQFMSFEVTKDLKLTTFEIETPIAKTNGYKLATPVVLVPILRAGLGMVDGFKLMIPQAAIGHLGLYRDEKTLKPVQYYCKMPDRIEGADVIILDPMLATGFSTIKAIDIVKTYKPKSIRVACVIAAPEGLKEVSKYDDSIQVFACALDEKLNENSYIVPGLGSDKINIFFLIYLSILIGISFLITLILSVVYNNYTILYGWMLNIPFILTAFILGIVFNNLVFKTFGQTSKKGVVAISILLYCVKYIVLLLGLIIGVVVNRVTNQEIFNIYALFSTAFVYPVSIFLGSMTYHIKLSISERKKKDKPNN